MKERSYAAVVAVLLLLLLPASYVGSYLALVTPYAKRLVTFPDNSRQSIEPRLLRPNNYRSKWAARVFWPVEQIDRRLFPSRWN